MNRATGEMTVTRAGSDRPVTSEEDEDGLALARQQVELLAAPA